MVIKVNSVVNLVTQNDENINDAIIVSLMLNGKRRCI